MLFRITAVALIAMIAAGCHSERKKEAAAAAAVTWRPVGSWSGRGNAQTESFEIGFEQCRIRWTTSNETSPGAGIFRVMVHSAVSGRELAAPVDTRGAGQSIAYVSVDPHFSYLVIESSNLDWSVTVEEPAAGDAPKQ